MQVLAKYFGNNRSATFADIVNQTDYLASLDGDVKLGQPLVNVSWEQNQHLVDFYVLPYFRERPFAGTDGRLRLPYVIDSEASYESGAKRQHLDIAFRYQFNQQNLRLGISGFSGTSREPILSPVVDPSQFNYMATPFWRNTNRFCWQLSASFTSLLSNHPTTGY